MSYVKSRTNERGIAPRAHDWVSARDAFIKRPIRPTYEEISQEFGIPLSTIKRASLDEGWPLIRENSVQQALERSGAGDKILAALASSRAIVAQGERVGGLALQRIGETLNDMSGELAPSTRAGILVNLTMAINNLAGALKNMGITGFIKGMQQEGAPTGAWNPNLLQQINVTVQNLTEKAKQEKAAQVVDDSPV